MGDDPLDLLRRIREWDHLPLTGDGPYWIREIDRVLAAADVEHRKERETPVAGGDEPL